MDTQQKPGDDFLKKAARDRIRRSFVKASDVERKEIQWLWKPYLPRGCVTLLAGDGGIGKSMVTSRLAAAVSKGAELPGGWKPMAGNPATAMILGAEDDLGAVTEPRLALSEADLERVLLHNMEVSDDLASLTPAALAHLDAMIDEFEARLVVIDPIVSFMGDDKDMHRANEVRPMLRELNKIAERRRAAVLVVAHLNKNETAKASSRVAGSVDFRNAVRSLLLAGWISDEPERGYALFHDKCNYAGLAAPLGYEIEEDAEWHVARAVWRPHTDLTSPEVFQGKAPKANKTKTATDVIRAVLGKMPDKTATSDHVQDVLEAALPGVSSGTIQKARDAAPVKVSRYGDGSTDWTLIDLAGGPARHKPMRLPDE